MCAAVMACVTGCYARNTQCVHRKGRFLCRKTHVRTVKGALLGCKTRLFAVQYGAFRILKWRILCSKAGIYGMQMGLFCGAEVP